MQPFQDVGRYVIGSPANGVFTLVLIVELAREPEVGKFDLHLIVYQHVCKFNISMDDVPGLDVL